MTYRETVDYYPLWSWCCSQHNGHIYRNGSGGWKVRRADTYEISYMRCQSRDGQFRITTGVVVRGQQMQYWYSLRWDDRRLRIAMESPSYTLETTGSDEALIELRLRGVF